jgi:hypothetical protein
MELDFGGHLGHLHRHFQEPKLNDIELRVAPLRPG